MPFKAIRSIRTFKSPDEVRRLVSPEMEIAYIKDFITKFSTTWAEIQIFHKQTKDAFPSYECVEGKDGTFWLCSGNGWE